MLRARLTFLAFFFGTACASLAAAQPADQPAGVEPTPDDGSIDARGAIGLELANSIWHWVVPDVITPLPRASAQPAQRSHDIVRSGDDRAIASAQRDFERRNDADLRELHASLSYTELQAVRAYVETARFELPQIRNRAIAAAVCHGKARSGLDLAAAHLAAEELYSERLREIVAGLSTVLDADSFDRIVARGTSTGGRTNGRIVNFGGAEHRAAFYATLSRDGLAGELRRVCGGVWSHHSDAQRG